MTNAHPAPPQGGSDPTADPPDESLDIHRTLSPAAVELVRRACADPAMASAPDYDLDRLPAWIRSYEPAIQSWPTLISEEKQAEVEGATVELCRLIKEIPERIFDGDVERIARFYGFPNALAAALLLEPPNGIAGAIARGDFIDGPSGFKCLEYNMGSFLGGWQLRYWQEPFFGRPPIRRLLADLEVDPRYVDPLYHLFAHVVGDIVSSEIPYGGAVNTAVVIPAAFPFGHEMARDVGGLYREVAQEQPAASGGRLFFTRDSEALAVRQGSVWLDGEPIHAVIEYSEQRTPAPIFRCFKAQSVKLYNGPVSDMLSDKRNLALLSHHEDSDRFDPAERELIRDHVPWTRELSEGTTTYRGRRVAIPDFVLDRREGMVVKSGAGSGGDDVLVGRFHTPERWAAGVRTALDAGGWLVQEVVDSHGYVYQHGDCGSVSHDVVWGLFCYGTRYGGGFLRMAPSGTTGVVNSSQGASEGFLLEV